MSRMDSFGTLLGLLLARSIQFGAVLIAVWALWNGAYAVAAAFALLLAYYAYLVWRPIPPDDLLEPP